MKVTVTKKESVSPVYIGTDYIKLQDAMKLANLVLSGGEAKALIQEGQLSRRCFPVPGKDLPD